MPNSAFVINDSRRRERAEKRNIMKEINCLLNENESNNNQNENDSDLSHLSPGQESYKAFTIDPLKDEYESKKKENEYLKEINKQISCEMAKLKSDNCHFKKKGLMQY